MMRLFLMNHTVAKKEILLGQRLCDVFWDYIQSQGLEWNNQMSWYHVSCLCHGSILYLPVFVERLQSKLQ